ncbi:THO complex subunit 7, partial [Lecanoromycetidae sp. Uapishka_2]
MATYALLDQAEEDALHKSRLLNVEEKPFKRITKRLLAATSLISSPPTLPPTPPPDASAADEAAAAHETEKQQQLEERRQWREDALLDFAAFESSIIRIQFLLTSNHKERERYAAEKLKIEATAQAVRDNTADLRIQLEEAQKTLALRKEYDELADKITSKPVLQSRESQHANLAKLNAEIADLQRESEEYAETWVQRRQQFGRIIEEGMQLRRLIRDEKEEVERREGMEEGEDGDEDIRGGRSSGVATPRSTMGGTTPMHLTSQEQEVSTPGGLGAELHRSSRGRSPLNNTQTTDNAEDKKASLQEAEDEEMAEDGELAAEPEGVTAAPVEGLVATDETGEEGTEKEERAGDQMDTT